MNTFDRMAPVIVVLCFLTIAGVVYITNGNTRTDTRQEWQKVLAE